MKHTREHHRQWKAHIEKWHSSGKSQKAFCRENGLSYWQFRYYLKSSELYRPRKAAYKQSGNHSDFIRVEKEAIPADRSVAVEPFFQVTVDASGIRLKVNIDWRL